MGGSEIFVKYNKRGGAKTYNVVPKWQFCPKSVLLTYQTSRGKIEIRNSRFLAYENIFSVQYQRNKYAKILILKEACLTQRNF